MPEIKVTVITKKVSIIHFQEDDIIAILEDHLKNVYGFDQPEFDWAASTHYGFNLDVDVKNVEEGNHVEE